MRKSVVNQTENAFQAYINLKKVNSILSPVNVYSSQSLVLIQPSQPGGIVQFQNITPPDLIFMASDPAEYIPDERIYELKLKALLETQLDDEMAVANQDIHHARVEILRDFLEDFSSISSSISQTSPIPYTLSSIVFENESEENIDRRFITTLDYFLIAAPWAG